MQFLSGTYLNNKRKNKIQVSDLDLFCSRLGTHYLFSVPNSDINVNLQVSRYSLGIWDLWLYYTTFCMFCSKPLQKSQSTAAMADVTDSIAVNDFNDLYFLENLGSGVNDFDNLVSG